MHQLVVSFCVGLVVSAIVDGGVMKTQELSLPRQIGEWRAEGTDQTYDRKSIYQYIDGGAELYLAYDFQQVLARTFTGPGQGEIVLEVYEMGSAADAFGVFTSEREEADAGIGQGSEFGGGLLRFWKGDFFVSVMASTGGEGTDAAVLEIGKEVAAAILENGAEPELLNVLPDTGCNRDRIRYFHMPLQLEKHYFVADENILGLSPKTECVLAECPLPESDPITLLVVRYEQPSLAGAAYSNFLNIYMPEATNGVAKMENGGWTMARCSGRLVKIVFDSPDEERAATWMAAMKDR
ncbi:MAG: DUF6599 family protein [Acidobacteriota bacterium]